MRRVRLSVAMSLDGCIAGPNGEFDWIPMDPDIDFGELFSDFDTVLMGRKSYEAARAQQGGLPELETFVFSRTLRQAECPGVTVSSDPASTVATLKAALGKDLWLYGGGSLFRSFLDLGLVDGIDVAIVPVVLGHGLPLVPQPASQTRLELTGHRVYQKTGTVLLQYTRA